MEFDIFLLNFRQKLNEKGPKVALDFVFGTMRMKLDQFRPTQLQTAGFIDYLQVAITRENKNLSDDRAAALDKIREYNKNTGDPFFEGIDPYVFAFQLALRIREPSLINQRVLGICAENSLMIYFAENIPSQFADYGILLMRTGEGTFRGLKVKLASRAGTNWQSYSTKLAAADFVTMCSLSLSFFGQIKEGITGDDIKDRLKRAGFLNAKNDWSSLESDQEERFTNLSNAEKAVDAKKLVIIGFSGGIVEFLQDLKRSAVADVPSNQPEKKGVVMRGSGATESQPEGYDAGALKPTGGGGVGHAVTVSRLKIQKDKVTIKLYSWGDSIQGTFPLRSFLTYYRGHVVADPPDESS